MKPGGAEAAMPRTWLTLADRAARLGAQGAQLPTSFATLDASTRGGPRVGKLVVAGGAPGAGKTSWLVQLGTGYAMRGVHVGLLAADEDADALVTRVGQLLGFDRDDIESGRARVGLQSRLAALPNLLLVDQDEDGAGIEDVSEELTLRACGGPAVLIVDSIQTARCAGSDDADGPRARVDTVMAALKRAAKAQQQLVFASCELNRGSYRGGDPAQRVDDLAAFKESGGVEYGASVALLLRSVKDAGGSLVDVTCPKNRLGQRQGWRMSFDFARAAFAEVAAPAPAEARDPHEERKARVVLAIQQALAPITSKGALAAAAGGGRTATWGAIDALMVTGRIEQVEGAFRLRAPLYKEGGEA